ncbi:MAG TPA: DUF2844 domain-containing protein [Nitrospira sp.]|nr:DUF2844 domain-containing protein [Nitrospira sp.]
MSQGWFRSLEEIFLLTLAAVLMHWTLLPPVWAALGQASTSVEQDRAMMKGQRQSRAAMGYSVETIVAGAMTIHEYVSSDGHVFAVAWKGTGTLDLPLLLGEYFEEYRDGVIAERNQTPRMRKPLVLKTARLVVERGGHSRFSWGRAFLPSALPPGVTAQDIQ